MTFSTPDSSAESISSISNDLINNDSNQLKENHDSDSNDFKRLEKNKLAARRFRIKKKEELIKLKQTVVDQMVEIEKLTHANKMMKLELNSAMRQVIESCMHPIPALNPAAANIASSFLVSQSSVDSGSVKAMMEECHFKPQPHYVLKPVPQHHYSSVFYPPPRPFMEPTDSTMNLLPAGKILTQTSPFHPYYDSRSFRYSGMNKF